MIESLQKISMVDNEPEPDEVGRTSEGASHLRRYPAYKDSGVPWLGEIPAHWEIGPGLSAFREKKVKNTGMVENTVLSLSYGKIVVKPPEKLHGLVPASFETYQIVEPTDIIIRPTDLQNDWTSLRVGLARNRGIITSAYMCLRTIAPTIPDYGYLLLHAYDLMKVFYGMGSGLRQNLDFSDLKRMLVLLPPPDEQRAIARFLEAIDRLTRRYINAQRRLIALLTEQKQALIQQAVTRGLNPDAPLKDSGIEWLGQIPAHWETIHLKHVATVQTGLTLGKDYGSLSLEERPYLRVANVQDGFLDLSFITTIRVPQSEIVRCELQTGDILMTEGGDRDKLGRGYIWHGEISGCLHQNHIFAVRVNADRLLPEYLILLMTSPYGRRYFELTAKQTTNLASTNTTKLKAFPLLLPSVEEQKRIAEYVAQQSSGLVSAITRTQHQIDLVREYRTRLIADVVTGKLDVRGVEVEVGRTSESASHLDLEDETDFEDTIESGDVSELYATEEEGIP